MSLDVELIANRPTKVFKANITHNLVEMAVAANCYDIIWRPEIHTHAKDLIEPLKATLTTLYINHIELKQRNPKNYDALVDFVIDYLKACEQNPDAEVRAYG